MAAVRQQKLYEVAPIEEPLKFSADTLAVFLPGSGFGFWYQFGQLHGLFGNADAFQAGATHHQLQRYCSTNCCIAALRIAIVSAHMLVSIKPLYKDKRFDS